MAQLSRYEALILTIPEITQDETAQLEKALDQTIIKSKAVTVSFERWGKYKLAYPVKKNEYGVYFLTRFETEHAPDETISEIKALFRVKLHTLVMRHMISVLDIEGSLAYDRPLSLEEAPESNVSGFLSDGMRNRGRRPRFSRDDRDDRPRRDEERSRDSEGQEEEKKAEKPASKPVEAAPKQPAKEAVVPTKAAQAEQAEPKKIDDTTDTSAGK